MQLVPRPTEQPLELGHNRERPQSSLGDNTPIEDAMKTALEKQVA
jgi:hypothetical protein